MQTILRSYCRRSFKPLKRTSFHRRQPLTLRKQRIFSFWSHQKKNQPIMVRFYSSAQAEKLTEEEVTNRVLECVKAFEKVEQSKITPNAHFQRDLGIDSLDTVELVLAIEDEFSIEIPDEESDKLDSIPAVIQYIMNNPHVK